MPINERNATNFKDELRDTLKDAECIVWVNVSGRV